MDMDYLNFRDEEHFPFEVRSFLDCDESSLDGTNDWEWEHEQEINGDIAIIPISSNYTASDVILSNSPPSKEAFQKLMSDWHHIISIESENMQDVAIEDSIHSNNKLVDEPDSGASYLSDFEDHRGFDIAKYVTEVEPTVKPKIPGKKIDLAAQKYIVEDPEDCHVDVETISEHGASPVLEAPDLNSLLEQFEANEIVSPPTENEQPITCDVIVKVEPETPENEENASQSEERMEFEYYDEQQMMKMMSPQNEDDEIEIEEHKPDISSLLLLQFQSPVESGNNDTVKSPNRQPSKEEVKKNSNKESIEALPEELLSRMKDTGKRKPISVIPAIIPNKRRSKCSKSTVSFITSAISGSNITTTTKATLTKKNAVQLEHNYCNMTMLHYQKNLKKDSGFESSEDEERQLLRNQPTVKNADGKVMVSLLKSNTICHNVVKIEKPKPKRKLNLEEYKKRRVGCLMPSNENSGNSSPMTSGCNSPVPPQEDELTKLRKHQEKLMKMASEILKTQAKSAAAKTEADCVDKADKNVGDKVLEVGKSPPQLPVVPVPPPTIVVPADMEVKMIVSIGVNTDASECFPPLKQLEEIKPILQKAAAKIGSNSLITSLIENIPKVKHKLPPQEPLAKPPTPPENNEADTSGKNKKPEEHGEDKTIIYLPKNRKQAKLCSVYVQTEDSNNKHRDNKIEPYKPRRRRRRESSKSPSVSPYRRCRNNSNSSRYSTSSSSSVSSSRSSSRSRSRSISPWNKRRQRIREEERIREVEERRVIYVGRISPGTTREDLRKRFQKFGPITNVSVHFRDHGDNYGFVTFINKLDAYEAVEHGNDDPFYPKYDLSFGGRRMFCKTSYSDLDDMRENICYFPSHKPEDSFDMLLKKAQEKLKKRKF